MMHEHHSSWNNADWDSSYYHFLRGRFILDDWETDRIAANRDRFLAFETRHKIALSTGERINRGFLIIDSNKGQLLGERRTGHTSDDPHTASGIDTVRPSERGKGLSRDFFELGCLVAKQLGYQTYTAGIAANLPASYKRLERMVKEGRAEKLPSDWDGARRYRIDLRNFSARCG